MTSLATLIGLIPMAAETRHRQRSLCAARPRDHRRPGVVVVLTVFIVPAAYHDHLPPPRTQSRVYCNQLVRPLLAIHELQVSIFNSRFLDLSFQHTLLTAAPTSVRGRSRLRRRAAPHSLTPTRRPRHHPRISVADLKALAAKQVTREARSAFFPISSAVLSRSEPRKITRGWQPSAA